MPVTTTADSARKCNNCGEDAHTGQCDASKKICTRCGKPGHATRRCRKRRKPGSSTKPQTLYCNNCEQQGHSESGCSKPPGYRRRCPLCRKIGHLPHACTKEEDWCCANCAQWGHLDYSCTKPRGYLHMHCLECKEQGHLAEDCVHSREWICTNCFARGHYHTECPLLRTGGKCFRCSASSHVTTECTQMMCYKCGSIGHSAYACTDHAWLGNTICLTCRSKWHITDDCPLDDIPVHRHTETEGSHHRAGFKTSQIPRRQAPRVPNPAAARHALAEAREKLEKEEYNDAVYLLTEAIAWDSSSADLYSTRGIALSKAKCYVEALSDFSAALKLRGHEPLVEVLIETARCRFRLGSRSSALLAVREALARDAENLVALSLKRCLTELEVHFESYRSARSRKHWRAAKTAYDACLKIYEDREVGRPLEVGCWSVELLIAENAWTKALAAVEKITSEYPAEPEGLVLKARVLMLSGTLDAALDQAVAVLRLDPDNAAAKHLRSWLKDVRRLKEEGNTNFKANEWADAVDAYTRALEVLSEGEEDTKGGLMRTTFLLNRATSYYKMNSYNNGLKDANEALTLDPAYFKAYRARARIYVGLELYDSAVEDFKAAVEHGASLLDVDGMRSLKDELENTEQAAECERQKGKDYYSVLGLSRTCSAAEIKKAYRQMSLKHHPDKGGVTEKFKLVNEAYETLSDPGARSVYDMKSRFASSSFYESDSGYFSQEYERSWRDYY